MWRENIYEEEKDALDDEILGSKLAEIARKTKQSSSRDNTLFRSVEKDYAEVMGDPKTPMDFLT